LLLSIVYFSKNETVFAISKKFVLFFIKSSSTKVWLSNN